MSSLPLILMLSAAKSVISPRAVVMVKGEIVRITVLPRIALARFSVIREMIKRGRTGARTRDMCALPYRASGRALAFIVRIFVNDTITIAVWTSFHAMMMCHAFVLSGMWASDRG